MRNNGFKWIFALVCCMACHAMEGVMLAIFHLELCAGSGLFRDRRQSIASAILPSISHTVQLRTIIPLCFACRRLLCSASRTSRDTPQSSIAWTLHASIFISRGLKFSNVEGLRFQSHGSSWLTSGTKNLKNPCIPLKLSR